MGAKSLNRQHKIFFMLSDFLFDINYYHSNITFIVNG